MSKWTVACIFLVSMMMSAWLGARIVRDDQSYELKRLQHFRDHFTCKGEYYYKPPEGGFEHDYSTAPRTPR